MTRQLLTTAIALTALLGLGLGAAVRADDIVLDGATVYREQCGRCHQRRAPSDLDPQAWATVVFHMRTRALLTQAEVAALQQFLAPPPPTAQATQAAPTGVRANPDVAAHCVQCHDTLFLDLAIATGRSVELWRTTIDRMRVNGCVVDKATGERIAAWLAEQEPPAAE